MDGFPDLKIWEGCQNPAIVRVDTEKLLSNKDKTMDAMEKVYNYFIRGMIKQALKDAQKAGRLAKIGYYLGRFTDWLGKTIGKFLKDHNIKIDIFKGLLEISPAQDKTGQGV